MTVTVDARMRQAVEARYFYVLMAACCIAIAFLGFAPTYWLPLAAGAFKANPVVHIHGLAFFSWTLFYLVQAWLVASGRTAGHRSFGLIGISLATVMTMLGILAAINQRARSQSGRPTPARRLLSCRWQALRSLPSPWRSRSLTCGAQRCTGG